MSTPSPEITSRRRVWGWAGVLVSALVLGCDAEQSPGDTDADTVRTVAMVDTSVTLADPREGWAQLDDPSADGWPSEALADAASAQLKKLAKRLASPGGISVATVGDLAAPDFRCGPLRGTLREVFRDNEVIVSRTVSDSKPPAAHEGVAGFVTALQNLARPFRDATDVRWAFKLFRLSTAGDTAATRQYVSVSGRTPSGTLEENSTWDIDWNTRPGGPPLLNRMEVVALERVRGTAAGTLFTDCTASVLAANACYGGQFLYSHEHWLARLQDRRYFSLFGAPGLALGDVNGDGLDDFYVCQDGGLPNRLFVHNPDGTARDVSAAAGVDWLESTRSALFADLDNDGDQDLVVTVFGNLVIAANDGQGKFARRAVLPTANDAMSLSAADPDGDGDLDLYLCAYNHDVLVQDASMLSIGGEESFVYHDAQNGGRNQLFRNDIKGDLWRFADVTDDVGLERGNHRFSFAGAWEDYDGDGDQDLYVANDFGRNNLYRNDSRGGDMKFVDVAARAGVEDQASGMGVTWGDPNRDGHPDIYVSNMFSSAGGRVTRQTLFKPNAPRIKEQLQRFARGNTLLQNRGDGTFEDTSEAAGVLLGRWAWSSNFVDINNDGWDDIVVANGYLTTDDKGDL